MEHLRISPIVLDDVRALYRAERRYRQDMAAHDANTLVGLRPSGFQISTMTVVVRTSVAAVNLERLKMWILDPANLQLAQHMGYPLSATAKNADRQGFYNQLTLRVIDAIGKKAIKVFVNGMLHITGAKSVKDFLAISHTICTVLERASQEPEQRIDIQKVDICMINSNFCSNQQLRLMEVKNRLLMMGKDCGYDPEGYPAAKFKHKNVSIFAFASGKIIVTGGKSFDDILGGYMFITTFLDVHGDHCRAKPLCLAL